MLIKYVLLCLITIFCQCPLAAYNTLVVGIAGGSGSGKTTFTKKIKETFGDSAVLLEVDSYYKDLSHLPPDERKQTNFDHPDSIDFALLLNDLLILKQGLPIFKPVYDFKTHTRTTIQQQIDPARVILVEGVLLLAIPEIRELCDIKLYIDVEDDIRLLRRIERDMTERGRSFDDVKFQYLATVKPMHTLFVAPSKAFADLIVPSLGDTSTAEKIISSRLQLEN